ncbi:LytR family transcriptional regulator [candidate division WS5 bacterium]|uniref:LytR family transcriptional regulator n=1 Tax=candidate division WS5 bacterium TaxID=2093353 RepID=A0A419DE43_9BACT|nr:MAG: LytR family transcriptional regulator [candidate division WS5 bacterium]
MSKKSIDDILSGLENEGEKESVKEDKEKTPVKFKKKKKKSWKKRIILSLLVIFLVGGSIAGVKAYMLAQKIFKGEGLPGLLGLLGQEKLKGEAEGRINILLLGMGGENHPGGTLTDTIMVASIKPDTKEVAMLSIPRDLYVEVDGHGEDKINAAHALGEQKGSGEGMALAAETVSKTLDIPIHYTVRVDFEGFSKIIDAVDGVDVDVKEDLYDPYYPDGGSYYVEAGQHHMNGEEALKYARSRKTTSDFDRAKRQQQIMGAVKAKVLTADTLLNPTKMGEILGALGDHIKTDMQVWEGQRLAQMFKDVDQGKIISRVLDNSDDGPLVSSNAYGAYVLLPRSGNFEEVQNIAKNIFTNSNLWDEAAKVQVQNATGSSGQAKKASDRISGMGLKIEDITTSGEINSETIIYDYTNGAKPKTIEFLEKEFCVTAVKKSDPTGMYDITIVVGKDQLSEN